MTKHLSDITTGVTMIDMSSFVRAARVGALSLLEEVKPVYLKAVQVVPVLKTTAARAFFVLASGASTDW